MKTLAILIILSVATIVESQTLPEGIRIDTIPCKLALGFNSYYLYKNSEDIASIVPENCHYGYEEDLKKNPAYITDFYPAYQKDTFSTVNEAFTWVLASIEAYYKPVVIEKWQKLAIAEPELSFDCPVNWSTQTENYPIFNSKSNGKNKLVLLMSVRGGNSQIGQIIRTPNTSKYTTIKVMEITAQMNRAIDLKANPAVDQIIDGKAFKTMNHVFMEQMQLYHFWFADEKEIIYLTYGLLKDDRIRYPEVLKQIVQSIKW